MRKSPLLLFLIAFVGCIGTDFIDDPIQPERLTIFPRIDSLPQGQTMQFWADYFNEFGIAETVTVDWSSTDPTVVTIDANGWAEAVGAGPVKIIATGGNASDTLVLNTIGVTNTTGKRTGTLSGDNGYNASGSVRLEELPNETLQLVFEDNFSCSAGPSVYVLLTNHLDGAYSLNIGGNAINGSSAQITPNKLSAFSGEMIYSVPPSVGIDDYQYVVLYCALGPIFGFAELN